MMLNADQISVRGIDYDLLQDMLFWGRRTAEWFSHLLDFAHTYYTFKKKI